MKKLYFIFKVTEVGSRIRSWSWSSGIQIRIRDKRYGSPTLVVTVQSPIGLELDELPVNTPLLQLIGSGEIPVEYRSKIFFSALDKFSIPLVFPDPAVELKARNRGLI